MRKAEATSSKSRRLGHVRSWPPNASPRSLSEKGLYRFYVDCCKTPIGNLIGPAIPFVGIFAQVFEGDARSRDALLGKPSGAIHGQDAIGTAPPGSKKVRLSLHLRVLRLVIGWRLTGKAWPHPFFDRTTGAPKYPVKVVSKAERDALRPLCGPRRRDDRPAG